ncbi:MAG: radical SAM protein [bacterium]
MARPIKVGFSEAKSILTRTRIAGLDWCLNAYVGCSHGCRYCYASFMKRMTGHTEEWGKFVDLKLNAPQLLERELKRKPSGKVMISSVTDPYQPVEKKYEITRKCLSVLTNASMAVVILTKSDLIVRDIDLLKRLGSVEAGLTITTDDERIRQIFEPFSPSLDRRIEALARLKMEKIPNYAFIGPLLPCNPGRLAEIIARVTSEVLIDKINYPWKVQRIYAKYNLLHALDDRYFEEAKMELSGRLTSLGVNVKAVD